MKSDNNHHGVGDVSMCLVLVCCEWDVAMQGSVSISLISCSWFVLHQCPCYNARSPVEEQLNVPGIAEAWVQLQAHPKIVNPRSCTSAYLVHVTSNTNTSYMANTHKHDIYMYHPSVIFFWETYALYKSNWWQMIQYPGDIDRKQKLHIYHD